MASASYTAGASTTVGTSSMAGKSTIAGVSYTVGVSNIAGASDTMGVSNTAGTYTLLIAIALQGASTTLGAPCIGRCLWIRGRDLTNCRHVSTNSMRQPEDVGNQVKHSSI
jgi:hypothetical protein